MYNGANSLTLNYNQLYAVALGANPVELGSLNSVGSVISSAVSVPAGWLIDKYGVKSMLVTGLVLCALVSVLYGCATSWLTLLPAVMLVQLGVKLIMPLADIIFVSTTRVENRARLMGAFTHGLGNTLSLDAYGGCDHCVSLRWHNDSGNTTSLLHAALNYCCSGCFHRFKA
jgi:MFS family permease